MALTPLHRVEFVMVGGQLNGPVGVVNVSADGIGLLKHGLEHVAVGDSLKGELRIGGTRFPIAALVRHTSGSLIGCRIEDSSDALSRAIDDYFRIEMLGLKLRQMNSDILKKDPLGAATWFSDGGLNELYFVESEGRIARFHMTLFGQYIEGGDGRSVRTGQVVDDAADGLSGFRKGSPMVEIVNESSRKVLELGRQLLRNIDGLKPEIRDAIEAQLGADDVGPIR